MKRRNNSEKDNLHAARTGPLHRPPRRLRRHQLNTNKALYDNPEVTELIEKAAATPDGPERQELYYRVQQIVYDEIPYLGIQHGGLYFAAQKGVGGIVFFPSNHIQYTGIYRLKDVE